MTDALSSTPPCAVCGQWRHGARLHHHLTHGVSLWLCEAHHKDEYLRRAGGKDFVERLTTVWAASDALTSRRRHALRSHLRRMSGAPPLRELPGSYSWPALRREAERRFASGEAPDVVIAELRQSYGDGPSIVPSLRTMRRWFTQARWLARPSTHGVVLRRRSPTPRTETLTYREQLVNLMLSGYAFVPRARTPRLRGP